MICTVVTSSLGRAPETFKQQKYYDDDTLSVVNCRFIDVYRFVTMHNKMMHNMMKVMCHQST